MNEAVNKETSKILSDDSIEIEKIQFLIKFTKIKRLKKERRMLYFNYFINNLLVNSHYNLLYIAHRCGSVDY